MAKGRGQQASDKTWNINRALSELRGVMRERPSSLWSIANLVWRWDQGDVMLDYALGHLPPDRHEAFRLQLKLTPALYRGLPIEIPQPLPPIWRELELTNIYLEGAELAEFDLSGLRMVNADLGYTDLVDAKMADIDLTNANLVGALLTRSSFKNANLTGANLLHAKVDASYFWEEDSVDGGYDAPWTVDFSQASLAGAKLKNAQLPEANLWRANLEGADLTNADLHDADLDEAHLWDANLTGADLRGANLEGADLTGADLSDVMYDDMTVWPEGFDMSDLD